MYKDSFVIKLIGSTLLRHASLKMTMNQTKLTKDEWNAVEIPVTSDELSVLKFIQRGFEDPDLVENNLSTLYTYLKLIPSPQLDDHLFHKY